MNNECTLMSGWSTGWSIWVIHSFSFNCDQNQQCVLPGQKLHNQKFLFYFLHIWPHKYLGLNDISKNILWIQVLRNHAHHVTGQNGGDWAFLQWRHTREKGDPRVQLKIINMQLCQGVRNISIMFLCFYDHVILYLESRSHKINDHHAINVYFLNTIDRLNCRTKYFTEL